MCIRDSLIVAQNLWGSSFQVLRHYGLLWGHLWSTVHSAYKQVAKITFTHNGKTAITVKKNENILEYISCLCPFLAALCNGVRPRSSRAFTSDMRFARASTCLDEAFSAARWSGVLLLSSLKPKRFCLDKTSSKIYKHESVCQSQCHLLFLMHLQPNLY